MLGLKKRTLLLGLLVLIIGILIVRGYVSPGSPKQNRFKQEKHNPTITYTVEPNDDEGVTEAVNSDKKTLEKDNTEASNPDQSSYSSSTATGYALAMDYWEQVTQGASNVQTLQCWAAQFNLSVVEPMVAGSQLVAPFTETRLVRELNHLQASERFWFRDLFDFDMWNQLSAKLSHSQLVPWDYFINNAPRNVILVSFKYDFFNYKLGSGEKIFKAPTPDAKRFTYGCSTYWDSISNFLNTHHFNVVREVCFNFAHGDKLTMEQFNAHVYGGHNPNSVTVIHGQWRGIGSVRILIQDNKCGNTYIQSLVRPSQKFLQAAAEYQQKFFHGHPYLAVMARLEKVSAGIKMGKLKQSRQGCFSRLLEVWKEVQRESGLNTTFLAADVGKFGSNTFDHEKNVDQLKAMFESGIFKAAYGAEYSVKN